MPVIIFPPTLKHVSQSLFLQTKNQKTASAFTDYEQVVQLPSARWVLSAKYALRNGDDFRAWRSFIGKCRGQFNPFLFKYCNKYKPRFTSQYTFFSDNTNWSDGTNADEEQLGTLFALYPRGTVEIQVSVGFNGTFSEGEYISIDNFIYRLENVSVTDHLFTLGIFPPLRKNTNSGSVVMWDEPAGMFRLATDDTGMIENELAMNIEVELQAVEVLKRDEA